MRSLVTSAVAVLTLAFGACSRSTSGPEPDCAQGVSEEVSIENELGALHGTLRTGAGCDTSRVLLIVPGGSEPGDMRSLRTLLCSCLRSDSSAEPSTVTLRSNVL
jgi:hypothetical protein